MKNHPFIDGNKRVGAATALGFLAMNGVLARCDQVVFEKSIIGEADGSLQKSDVAPFLREHCYDELTRRLQQQTETGRDSDCIQTESEE